MADEQKEQNIQEQENMNNSEIKQEVVVKEEIKPEPIEQEKKEEVVEETKEEEEVIDERELEEIEQIILEAENKKIKEIYDQLKQEISDKDKTIQELRQTIDNLKAEFERRLEEAINKIQPVRKGVVYSEQSVESNQSEEPDIETLKELFFKDMDKSRVI